MGYAIKDEDRICMNCKFWGKNSNGYSSRVSSYGVDYYECLYDTEPAVEADAGQSLVLFGEEGHCRHGADAFAPSEDFLAELADAEAIAQTERELDTWLNRQAIL